MSNTIRLTLTNTSRQTSIKGITSTHVTTRGQSSFCHWAVSISISFLVFRCFIRDDSKKKHYQFFHASASLQDGLAWTRITDANLKTNRCVSGITSGPRGGFSFPQKPAGGLDPRLDQGPSGSQEKPSGFPSRRRSFAAPRFCFHPTVVSFESKVFYVNSTDVKMGSAVPVSVMLRLTWLIWAHVVLKSFFFFITSVWNSWFLGWFLGRKRINSGF